MSKENNKSQCILVIDDDRAMHHLLKRILEPEGYNVVLASDGVSGLALLKQTQPDLVLLDISMPGLDGFKVIEHIRQLSGVPILMVTSEIDKNSIARALSLGADDYITKPFRPIELISRVRAKIRRTQGTVRQDEHAHG